MINESECFQYKKVLVTGSAGFIGSRLVEKLVEKGAVVRAFTRYTSRAELGFWLLCPKPFWIKLNSSGAICVIPLQWKAHWKAWILYFIWAL